MPAIASIQVGAVKTYGDPNATDPMDLPWTTGFFKEPVSGPVQVFQEQMHHDGQADRINHGGRDKAILAYAASHYPQWQAELGTLFPHGGFGENLTLTELTEATVCLGDVWQIGEVVVEVSQPRQPCWKLARRWKMKSLPALVVQTGRSGWYFRVQQTGFIAAGDALELRARPNPEWPISLCNRVWYHMKTDLAMTADLAAVPALSTSWRDMLHQRLESVSYRIRWIRLKNRVY